MITVREKVRFVETDMMGVAHHSNHFRWFEMARVEYLRQAGVLLLDLMAQDIVFPITDVSCQYKASARFDDWLLINAKLVDLSRAKMVFAYEIVRESDKVLLATGTTKNVFTSGSGKIIRLPQEYYGRMEALFLAEER